jgi:hypothetical protein
MREEFVAVPLFFIATYDNPVVALVCLIIMILLLKPFVFNNNDDD